MWFGTTIAGLRISPIRRSSMVPITISAVFPAPTWWNSPTDGSWIIRATAVRWWGSGVKFFASPGRVSSSPAAV